MICKELFIYLILAISLILSDLSTGFKVYKSDFVRPICKLPESKINRLKYNN
ncbi:hypothetical protein SAMN05444395_102342 [Flavobacterium fryxellicola]|nr:hypothetical protein SAMN05444395_102342 [Flavobacterium fryxellicola]